MRTWWAPVIVGVAIVLGLLIWLWTPEPLVPLRSLAVGGVASSSNMVPVATTRTPSAVQKAQGNDEVKVCRGDAASHEAPSPEDQQRQIAATDALRRHLTIALSTGASPETRALGAWLATMYAEGEAYSPYLEQIQLCKQSFECVKAVSAKGRVAVAEAIRPQVDEMVMQAVDSSSSVIYAMAVNACHSAFDVAPSPSCQRISAERWTQIDPGDASPWLRLLDEAAARHDTATANEAFFRASVADSVRTGGEFLLLFAEPVLSRGFSDAERLQLEWDIFGAQGLLGLPPMYAAVQQCSEEATIDSNRRQTCNAFTTMLLEKSSTLAGFHFGVRMAERLHWPPEKLEALRQERDALNVASSDLLLSDGCEPLANFVDRAFQRARVGEVASARASITASGRSLEELARLAEVRRQESMKAANTALAASAS